MSRIARQRQAPIAAGIGSVSFFGHRNCNVNLDIAAIVQT
jgi:hypothetical protein